MITHMVGASSGIEESLSLGIGEYLTIREKRASQISLDNSESGRINRRERAILPLVRKAASKKNRVQIIHIEGK